jgi:hypothetical protein
MAGHCERNIRGGSAGIKILRSCELHESSMAKTKDGVTQHTVDSCKLELDWNNRVECTMVRVRTVLHLHRIPRPPLSHLGSVE